MQSSSEPNSDEAAPTSLFRRHRLLIVGSGVVLLGLVVFVMFWFQPHKLFIDERVDEELPELADGAPTGTDDEATGGSEDAPVEERSGGGAANGDAAGETTTTTAVPDVVDLGTGTFMSLDHSTTGDVRIVELADGSRLVRLEELATDNGPDLYVYLSTSPADGSGGFESDYVSLGSLKGNLGNQNYEVPDVVDPTRFSSVVIWCDRFSVAFGAADLEFA